MFGMEKGILGIGGDPATLRAGYTTIGTWLTIPCSGTKRVRGTYKCIIFTGKNPIGPKGLPVPKGITLPYLGWALSGGSGNTVQMLDCYE